MDIKKIFEDAVMAAGGEAGGDVVAPSAGIGANDVLGHCDHKSDGYLGGGDVAGCFHIPSKCKVPFRREPCYGGSKRGKKKRTPYEAGMKVLTDAELTRDMILNLHKVRERAIRAFILNWWGPSTGSELSDAIWIQAICYHPISQCLFIKVQDSGNNKTWFCVADFDEKKKKFIPTKNEEYRFKDIMTATEARAEFKKILDMKGNSKENKGSDDLRLWLIWGDL